MQQALRLAVIGATAGLVITAVGRADPIFAPSDAIVAIDGTAESRSQENAPNEGVAKTIDQTVTKYLNFGMAGTGFIVVPAGGPSIVQSFQLTTANDSEPRDPSRYV